MTDLLIMLMLAASVPVFVHLYLGKTRLSARFQLIVMLGGIIWVGIGQFQESLVYNVLGIGVADAAIHWTNAGRIAQRFATGDWSYLWPLPKGNNAYVAYMALMHYFTGCSSHTTVTINGWMAFLGGLTLVRALKNAFPLSKAKDGWYLLIIFFPSTVFWTTSNMKEGLMYWASCQMIAPFIVGPLRSRPSLSVTSFMGLVTAGLLRPHVAVVWLFSGLAAICFMEKWRGWGILVLALLPAVFFMMKWAVPNVMTPEETFDHLHKTYLILNNPRQGSHIDYGPMGPVFFVSGFVALFFRPFPWEASSLRMILCAAETWFLTILMVSSWYGAGAFGRRQLLKLPPIWASILVCLLFSIFFTYLPNEGLLVRQRVQMVPALLILALTPILLKNHFEELSRLYVLLQYAFPDTGRPKQGQVSAPGRCG